MTDLLRGRHKAALTRSRWVVAAASFATPSRRSPSATNRVAPVDRLGLVPGELHRHQARYPGAFEVSHRGTPEVVGVTGYHFTFHPKDYAILLELLGQEEFERRVCPLDVARERLRERRERIPERQGAADRNQSAMIRTLCRLLWHLQ